MSNLILNTDGYKPSHYLQLPPKTTQVYSYIESRGATQKDDVPFTKTLSPLVNQNHDSIFMKDFNGFLIRKSLIWFGTQASLQQIFDKPITNEDIAEAEFYIKNVCNMPFNRTGWEYILKMHDGYMPLEINTIPEGTRVPLSQGLLNVTNTDPLVPWLPAYFETPILRDAWYMSTIASYSWHCKQIIAAYMRATSDNLDSLAWKLHDFGARGVSTEQSAGNGGMAHLINFYGSDTFAGIVNGFKYYGPFMTGTIPASEHSTITAWGREHEALAYENMLRMFDSYPIMACVSDSYNIYNAVENIWGGSLRENVEKYKGTLVIRPDSGDPVTVILKCLTLLENRFGTTYNTKGFKVLNPKVRLIQGDGVNMGSITNILEAMFLNGWSVDNISFGMGGALLQDHTRDDYMFAMKNSATLIDGTWVDVFKDPITDPGKASKKGKVPLWSGAETRCVFKNGEFYNREDFETVRARAFSYF